MEHLSHLILKVEEEWLNKLFIGCKELFSETKIPSHDHEHSKRVWNICKEIIIELSNSFSIDEKLLEACIIASFFHDTGLSKTLSENHGLESRKLCQEYFFHNNIEEPAIFDQILEAIEKHDDKEYKESNNNPYSILSILCAADDLDAFGRIGIIRYTEIYLLRGIGFNELPNAVIENMDKRFVNFERNYRFLPRLYNKYLNQYQIAKDFFIELKKEITSSY
ncbi:MAG: hypothetical protein A2W99_12245 [Bacteroidetes bacterium GWF2_33_16]|nr:MAG: hypothetical protein A2X00_02030 [Bacteroidetes bacterium GWE2_32_14]OFY06465.1 MAG: hypothetical protein A2W99_12245 [Bacteroidetes bacterium GWF2_33_16]